MRVPKNECCVCAVKRHYNEVASDVKILPSSYLIFIISTVHCVPTKTDNKNIIAHFISWTKKSDFMTKARKVRLTLGYIGISVGKETPLYVNDHLTHENKNLFAKILTLKKAKKWQFLWTDNCQIKAHKTTGCRIFQIVTNLSVITWLPLPLTNRITRQFHNVIIFYN